ncbi:MAG: hypothetical protein AB7O47_12080 [Flavobacteriales bacterium]
MKNLYIDFMLSVQRALLGYIRGNVRAVMVDWTEDGKKLTVKFILDRQPESLDYELISELTTEIWADFPHLESLDEACVFSDKKISKSDYLKGTAYMRYEKI